MADRGSTGSGRRTSGRPSSSTRPAGRTKDRTVRRYADDPPAAAGHPLLSRRLGILAGALVLFAVILVPTARAYLQQRSDIANLRDKVAAQQADVAALTREEARWDDPAFVEQQARQRLKFVRVGEKSYTILDGASGVANSSSSAVAGDDSAAWYGRVWSSVAAADAPTTAK